MSHESFFFTMELGQTGLFMPQKIDHPEEPGHRRVKRKNNCSLMN